MYGAARRTERMRDIEAAGGVALEMDVTDDATDGDCDQPHHSGAGPDMY